MMQSFFLTLMFLMLPLSLTGCSKNSGPGPEIHDTKYATIDANGEPTGTESGAWPCALDQYTGLLWEIKTDEPGLHDWRNTYSWYDPEESNKTDGLDYRGTPDGGECAGSGCDTWAYVKAVNQTGYCGHNDWRIPLRDELASISDRRKIETPPTINMRYFPYAQTGEYWTGNDYHFQFDAAWAWNFGYGHDRVDWKKTPKFVRLVRGEALHLTPIED